MIAIDLNSSHTLVAANAHFYKVPTDENYIDRTLQYHDLIYLVEGSWEFTENGVEYQLHTNDLLMLAAGRHHYTRLPCSPGTKTFCIHISAEAGDTESNPNAAVFPTLMNVTNAPSVKQCFENIVSTYWTDNKYKTQKLTALVNLLLLTVFEEFQCQKTKKVDIASKAIEMIIENPHKRYTAKEVADSLFISTKTLDNAMKKKVGVPFYTYLKNRKLDMVAMQLEMEPELKLHDIAASYCFHDEFHMSKAFKQRFGISPQEYRKQKSNMQ